MVRKLKYHERKLLKKVDFINWETKNLKEISMMRRFNITRNEYTAYNKLVREIKVLAQKIMELPLDALRVHHSGLLVERLHSMGVIETKRLKKCQKLSVKSFCKRRIAVFMISSGMFNGPLEMAVKYVQHGHVRVGPHVVKDPAFLVTREHEDFMSWDEKMKQKIDTYNDTRDDYDD